MIYIYKDRIIRLEWTILKGTSHVKENFDRALVKLFLIGPADKYLLDATAENGVITATIPQGLPEGNYSVEVIYAKNWGNLRRGDAPTKPMDERFNDRCLMRSRKDDLFGITNYESEADNVGEGEVVVSVKSSVATYGYDGLNSYELAVIRGTFIGTESAFIALINNHVTEHFAKYVNSIQLEWDGSAYLTRISTPIQMRRKGLMISYVNGEGKAITEKCVFDADTTDVVWGLDSSWQSVEDLVLGGELFVSPNGTWVINGVDSGIKAVGPKGDNGLTPRLKTIDNKLHYSYDDKEWLDAGGEHIAAWFRWSGNKIQISRDNKTWSDLSGEFADNLFIKGYVATYAELPSSAMQGDIWGVGPTYAADDTEQTNPIYRYYVKNASGWVDNGSFTSISAGIVQETGDGENVVMSQKAVSERFTEVESNFADLESETDAKLTELEQEVGILVKEKYNVARDAILFTSDVVNVGDIIEYSIISTNSTFGLFDADGNRIARADFVDEGTGNVSGTIEIPEGFSYAQVIWGSIDVIFINTQKTNDSLYNIISQLIDSIDSLGQWGRWAEDFNFSIDTENLTFFIPTSESIAIFAGNKSYFINGEKSCLIYDESSEVTLCYIIYNIQQDLLYAKAYTKGIDNNEVALAVIRTNYSTPENKKYVSIAFSGGAIKVDNVIYNSFSNIQANVAEFGKKTKLINDVTLFSLGKSIIPLEVGREHSSLDDIVTINIPANKSFTLTATTDAVFDEFYVKLYFADDTQSNITPILNTTQEYFFNKEIIACSAYVSAVKSAEEGILELNFNYANSSKNAILKLELANESLYEDLYGKKIVSYIWATSSSHSSSIDLIPVNINKGDYFTLSISELSAVCDNENIFAKLYFDDGTNVNFNDVILGETYRIRATKNIVNISFYIYQITALGEFKVEIQYLGEGLKADINTLQSITQSYKEIPPYYQEDDYLQSKLDEIITNVADLGANGIPFIFITDTHWLANAQHSPALVNYITQNSSVQDVIFGGDVIDGGENAEQIAAINDFGKKMNGVSPRFYALYGNHDANLNDGGTGFNSEVYYALVEKYADNIVNWGNLSYFYCDNKICKTRMVFLDTYKGQSGHTDSLDEQISWLNSVLKDCPNDYHIVVFQHIYFYTVDNDDLVPIVDAIVTALDNFNLTGGAKVEAIIAGHMHIDRNVTTPGGIPVVLTTCDVAYGQTGWGTINEQAFDVMTIDYVNRIIKCVRIGKGDSRTISY